MEYILTEKQISKLIEISYTKGGMEIFGDSFEDVFTKTNSVNEKKVKKYIKEYLENVLGYSKKMSDSELDELFNQITNFDFNSKQIPKELKNKDILSNMAYFLAKKIWGLKKLGSLEVLKDTSEYDEDVIHYTFFDPTLKLSIGRMSVQGMDKEDVENSIKLPKKSYRVSMSQIDKEFKGSGYGKEMYYSLIEDLEILGSDSFLYSDSLNIWVNVLPKKYFVFAIMKDNSDGEQSVPLIQITSKKKLPPVEYVRRYVVVKDPSYIKLKKGKLN